MARFNPDLADPPLAKHWPGLAGSATGAARRVMVRTGSFSRTTRALLCANCRAVLTQKSWRPRRSRARKLATATRVLLRLAEPLVARESLRCNRNTRRCSAGVVNT